MKGTELIKLIKQTGVEEKEVSINFSYENNGSFVVEIKGVDIECTNENIFINIGKIDKILENKDSSRQIPHINGWIEFYGNEKLFNVMAKKNCPCRFDDGSQCRYNDEHPIAELTHFKLV